MGDRSSTGISSGELWTFLLRGVQAEGGENQPRAKLEMRDGAVVCEGRKGQRVQGGKVKGSLGERLGEPKGPG